MQTKLRNWLLAKYDFSEVDIFEKAKIKLTADFAIYYLIFGLCTVLLSLFTNDILISCITAIFLGINLYAILSLRWTKSYTLTAKILSLNMLIGVIVISFVNHAIVDIMHAMHWVVALLFTYFTIGRKWTVGLIVILSVYIFGITFIKMTSYVEYFNFLFNPTFILAQSNAISPFVTLANIIIILLLLDFHRVNQNEALKIATNSNKLKKGILGVVAHDLRSPIANIVVINEFLKTNVSEPQNDDGESVAYTGMIDDMCQRSLNIINDLVDVAEIESANFSLVKEQTDLQEFVENALVTQHVKASKKNIKLLIEKPQDAKIEVAIDTHKFARVIDNLVTNAIKFTEPKGEVKFSISQFGKFALITVEDNGIGIPKHLQELVFDKFTSAGRRGTAGEKSLGLGMSISKRIVELHQGRIWFESVEGKGTSFFIELPLVK